MTVLIEKKRLLFVSAPKVACSSIKRALFEVENGFPFQNFYANGVLRHIHDRAVYPAKPFGTIKQNQAKSCLKITMVRDPIKRFLSAYSNRVVHYKELSERHIGKEAEAKGIPVNPSLSDFVAHLTEYREISRSIRLHTAPLILFLGPDPSYYDHIFDLSQMDQFAQRVSEHLGEPFTVPHFQTGGPKISQSELSAVEIRKIRAFYNKDYETFADFTSFWD